MRIPLNNNPVSFSELALVLVHLYIKGWPLNCHSTALKDYHPLICFTLLYTTASNMKTIASLASFVALATMVSADRTITVKNQCSYTVWQVFLAEQPDMSAERHTGQASSRSPVVRALRRPPAGRWPRERRLPSVSPTTGPQVASGPAPSVTSRPTLVWPMLS